MLLKYKISENKLDFVNKSMTAKTVYNTYKPTAFINACLYDMATSTNITNVKDETVADGYLFTSEGIGIRNGKPIWTTLNDTTVQDFIGGSPILVKGGKVSIEWGNKVSTAIRGKAYRSAIGFNDNYIFLFTSDTTLSLTGLANYMLGQGCKYAINLDGGGSCHLQVGTKTYKKSSRKNASWIMIYEHFTDVEETIKGSESKMKICCDYGHGKSTVGKRSTDNSLLEYEFNRDVGRRLKAILERHNIEVIETVTDDTDVSLSQRGKIANNNKVDYFVSIHANAEELKGKEWGTANGFETHIIAKGGKAEKLANAIQKIAPSYLGLKDRGVRVSNFQVLRDTNMPAVLIEHGFYTNKEECEKLKNDTFRQKCAEVDAQGILSFLGINYIPSEEKTYQNGNMSEENTTSTDWKVKEYEKALERGIITSESWKSKLNDSVDVGSLLAMLNHIWESDRK